MKLWTFLFTAAPRPVASARVAAPTKDEARALLAAALGQELGAGVIGHWSGEVEGEPGIRTVALAA